MPRRDDDFDDGPRRRRYDDDPVPRRRRKKGGMSAGVIIAIVIGVVALLGCAGVVVVGLIFVAPKARETSTRRETQDNLKRLALAVHFYMDMNNRLPPAALTEPNQPNGRRLLSWRVAILPYMEQDALYKRFKLDEPWDSPNNLPLLQEMPKAFQPPADPQPGRTHFRVFVGGPKPDRPRALFEWEQQRSVGIGGITDGTSNTLMIVEAADAVEWTKPDDFDFDPDAPLPKLGIPGHSTFNVALADGSVRSLRVDLPPDTIKKLITRNGDELVNFE